MQKVRYNLKSRGNYTELNFIMQDDLVFEKVRAMVKAAGGAWAEDPTAWHGGGYWYINTNSLLSIREDLEVLGLELPELNPGAYTMKKEFKFFMSVAKTRKGLWLEVVLPTDRVFQQFFDRCQTFHLASFRDVGLKNQCYRLLLDGTRPQAGSQLLELLALAQTMNCTMSLYDKETIEQALGVSLPQVGPKEIKAG